MFNHEFSQKHTLNRMSLASAIILFLIVNALSGCVSSSAYEEVSNERDELVKKRNALEGNTKLLRNKVEITEAKAERLKSNLEDVQSQLSDVNNLLEKKNDLLKEKNDLINNKNNKLSEVSQMLEEKNTRLSATAEELEYRQEELLKIEKMLAESNTKLQVTSDYIEKNNKLYDELVNELSSELSANKIKIHEMKNGVTVNLSQDILFPSGSATLNESGVAVIKKVSGKLKDIPHQIIVAGFTDNVPIKGDLAKRFPTNWELAGARSASVVRVLESQGVDSDKLKAVSFGENQPVASNDDWELRAQNRRIEIRLRPEE